MAYYLSLYRNIIKQGKNRAPFPGSHCHRIIPGYMGGLYISENIVYLTQQEHRVVHYIRYKLWGAYSDRMAVIVLKGPVLGNYIFSDIHRQRLSEASRNKSKSIEHIKSISQAKKGQKPWNKGKKTSNNIRQKQSNSAKLRHAKNKEMTLSQFQAIILR